jgi:putative nucleotidyltransferase with HDIG domain
MRLSEECGLSANDHSALFYAVLLKDAGCSSNAARMAALFGTADQDAKYRMKLTDWHRRARLAARTALTVARGQSLREKLRHFAAIAQTRDVTREVIQIRCERGAEIAGRLGLPSATCEAIRSLDEHWCGLGHPRGLQGEAIPLLARITNLAQTIELFHAREGTDGAIRVARQRRGSWFDPGLVDLVCGWKGDRDWWEALGSHGAVEAVLGLEPARVSPGLDALGMERVAEAFAEIIDAKSPFTFRHSVNVADIAVSIAQQLGMSPEARHQLRLAGLLHDIGKLGVSNRILDKAGKLDPEEWAEMRRHPLHSYTILSKVPAFRTLAFTAAVHHEKLDGSGYPWRLTGDRLDESARALAVADIYEALTADRPYRAGMTFTDAFAIIARERGDKLCDNAVQALESTIQESALRMTA